MLPFLGGMMLAGEDGPFTVWNPNDNTGSAPTFSADLATMQDTVYDGRSRGARGVNPRSTGKWCFDLLYGGPDSIIYTGLVAVGSGIAGGVGGDNTSSVVHLGGFSQSNAIRYGANSYGNFSIAPGVVATWLADLDNGIVRVARNGSVVFGDVPIGTGGSWLPYGAVARGGVLTIGGASYVPAGFSPWI